MPLTRLQDFIDKIARRRRGASPAEEILLDHQMRSFLQSEYAKETPPSGVFPRLMRAVHLHREEQQKRAEARIREKVVRNIGQLGRALTALYHTFGRGDTSRIISSGLVTALMLFAMWPSMKQMLVSNPFVSSLHANTSVDGSNSSYPTDLVTSQGPTQIVASTESSDISPSLVDEQRSLLLEQRNGEDLNAVPASEDPNYLHPFERGLGNKKAIPVQTNPTRQRPIIGQE